MEIGYVAAMADINIFHLIFLGLHCYMLVSHSAVHRVHLVTLDPQFMLMIFISCGIYALLYTSSVYMTLIMSNIPYPHAAYPHLHISFPAKNPEKGVLIN